MDLWAYAHKVALEFSRSGTLTDHVYIALFNGSLRAECVNGHGLQDVTEARVKRPVCNRTKNRAPLQDKAQWHTPMEAIHLALASMAGADFFATCDGKLLQKEKAVAGEA